MSKIKLSMDDLTLGDMELFEEATGEDIMEVLKPVPVIDPVTKMPVKDPDPAAKGRPLMETKVSAKAFIGLVYIAMRRDNPALTVADVKAMKLNDLDLEIDSEANVPLEDAQEALPLEGLPDSSES